MNILSPITTKIGLLPPLKLTYLQSSPTAAGPSRTARGTSPALLVMSPVTLRWLSLIISTSPRPPLTPLARVSPTQPSLVRPANISPAATILGGSQSHTPTLPPRAFRQRDRRSLNINELTRTQEASAAKVKKEVMLDRLRKRQDNLKVLG